MWTSPPEEHAAGGFDLSPGQTCLFLTQVRPEDFSAQLRSGELGWEARLQPGRRKEEKEQGAPSAGRWTRGSQTTPSQEMAAAPGRARRSAQEGHGGSHTYAF